MQSHCGGILLVHIHWSGYRQLSHGSFLKILSMQLHRGGIVLVHIWPHILSGGQL